MRLPHTARPLELALLCGGIDAPGHFLHQNKVNWFPKYFYDTADFLAGPLSLLHSADVLQEFCLGPEKGDLLGLDVCSMARVDGIVSGPPCPPFSSIGSRKCTLDPRESVFSKVTEVINHQGKLGCFFFIIETVPGISHQVNQQPSYLDQWLVRLSTESPMWRVQVFTLNSQEFCLPQSRQRIYILGTHKNHIRGYLPEPSRPVPLMPQISIEDILHPGLPSHRTSQLTTQQSLNLVGFLTLASQVTHIIKFWLQHFFIFFLDTQKPSP